MGGIKSLSHALGGGNDFLFVEQLDEFIFTPLAITLVETGDEMRRLNTALWATMW